jgi:hypothetical protein
MSTAMGPPDANKFAGCLIGQCLGDALGFIVEGQSTTACSSYVDDVVRAGKAPKVGRGRYSFGQYSDDSQLARELILSIVDRGKFDPADYAGRRAALFRENRIVGRGLSTQAAADRLIRGIPWNEAGTPPPSAGNGSAMRARPVGLFCHGCSDDLVQIAHDQGRITLQDRRCSGGGIGLDRLPHELALQVNDAGTWGHEQLVAVGPSISLSGNRWRDHPKRLSGLVSRQNARFSLIEVTNSVFPRSNQELDRFYLLASGRLQAKSTPPALIRTYCRSSSS